VLVCSNYMTITNRKWLNTSMKTFIEAFKIGLIVRRMHLQLCSCDVCFSGLILPAYRDFDPLLATSCPLHTA
jgi:hypothetical protein